MEYSEKKSINIKRCLKNVCLVIIAFVIGFIIAYFGNDESFVEDKSAFISAIITLFGLGLTSSIFVAQTLDIKKFDEEKSKKAVTLKASLASSLAMMAMMILIAVVMEFILSIISVGNFDAANLWIKIVTIGLDTLIYTLFSCVIILQVDITGCFIRIMKLK